MPRPAAIEKMIEIDDLTDKYKMVVRGVSEGLKAMEAGVKAGYSEKSAEAIVSKVMKSVAAKKYLDYLFQLRVEAEDDLVELWKQEMAAIAFTDRTKIIEDIIASRLIYVDFEQWPENIKKCVKGVKANKDGTMEIQFESKLDALDKLGKYLGMYEKDNKQKEDDQPRVTIMLPDNSR